MRRGRITVAASVVGSFDVTSEDGLHVKFHRDAVVRMTYKDTIVLTDGCSLEEAIDRVSQRGLLLGFDFESEYAAGDVGKVFPQYEDHKA